MAPKSKETVLQSLIKDIVENWHHEDIAISFSGEIRIHVNRIPADEEGDVLSEPSMFVISREDMSREVRHARKVEENQIIRLNDFGTAKMMEIIGIVAAETKVPKAKKR